MFRIYAGENQSSRKRHRRLSHPQEATTTTRDFVRSCITSLTRGVNSAILGAVPQGAEGTVQSVLVASTQGAERTLATPSLVATPTNTDAVHRFGRAAEGQEDGRDEVGGRKFHGHNDDSFEFQTGNKTF